MTTEVLVMNKYGVAMAADTVLTVATPHGPKLYNNVTKLFQLSQKAPVAIMVHGSVEFARLPWEILIKDYREKLADCSFDSVEEYGSDFIDYLRQIETDEDDQRDTVFAMLFGHFSTLAGSATEHLRSKKDSVDTTAAGDRKRIAAYLSSVAAILEQRPTIRQINLSYDEFVRRFRREILTAIKITMTDTLAPLLTRKEPPAALWRLAYLYTTKEVFSPSSSGIVLAGFGNRQLLPSVRGHTIDGKVCGVVKHRLTTRRDVTKKNQAIVMPFAQTEMVQRFMLGVDGAYEEFMETLFEKELANIADHVASRYTSLRSDLEGVKDEFEGILQRGMEQIRRVAADYRQEWYTKPIIDSLKNAPKNELAVLAQALVEITSLKRRMSTDVETVGEPIDVVVLSKADGLIWIRDAHADDIRMRAGQYLDGAGSPWPVPVIQQPPSMPLRSRDPPRRQDLAIVFADVHGYSQLMARNEERAFQRVGQAIRLIRLLVGDYGGQVQQVAGAGILALFETATQALQFAVAIQQEFRNEAVWHGDDEPIAFRIGIDVGEVRLGGEANVRGHSVNIATRIQALARPGGICVTKAVERAVHDTLSTPLRRLGPRVLKDLAEPIEVFAIEINGPPVPVPVELLQAPSGAIQLFTEPSIAVLPLANLSDDPRNGHLCAGVTDEIITSLSRFRDLLVIARHSTFLFKDRDIAASQIAGQLGVRYLVTGGLQRSGRKLRLRVQLTEAETERVIWSDRYDGDLGDLFAFQDEVTATVAARLAVQISAAEQRRVLTENPPELLAYGMVLRGQDLSLRFRKEANLHARRLFERAAEIDPDYGRCYAGMSRTFNLAWRYRWTPDPEGALDKAVDLANAAISYDSLDARGYGELGFACLYKKQHDSSLAAYERAIELNPNDADILAEMGDSFTYWGDANRAVQLLNRAMRLNPFYPDWYLWYLGEAYFHLGDYEETVGTLHKMRDQSEAQRLLASSYAHLGQMKEARYHAKQLLRIHPDFSIAHWRNVPPNKNLEELEVFIEGLRKAGLK